jgi:two-component system, response regulator
MLATTTRTILLVADNAEDEALTLRAMNRYHVANTVVVARDGAEALDYLFARGAHAGRDILDVPHLVLLDLPLPRTDGIDVLREIRKVEFTRLLPVVILTSSCEEEDIARGYALGANSYVRKPVDFAEFCEAIRQLGVYWLLINEPPPRPAPVPRS